MTNKKTNKSIKKADVNEFAKTLQASVRRAQVNPNVQIRGVMNDLINQVEYRAGAQQRAQQVLQTAQPLTSLSTSARTPRALGTVGSRAVPRARSAPVRRTSEISNLATDRIMDDMERQLTRIENNIAAVRPSTAIQRGAATRIQRAVRGAQAKKEMRNRIINEASRENQMQAARNRFNAIGEQMLNRAERQANIYGGEFIQQRARDRMKSARTTISNLDTRAYANPREAPEVTRQRANQTIQRMENIIVRRGPQGRPVTRSGRVAENESMQSMASTVAKGPKKK